MRAFHADVGALAMHGNGTGNARVGEHGGELRAGGLVEGDVGHDAIAEKSGFAALGAVEKLIHDKKFAGAQIIATLNQNADNAQHVLREAVKDMPVVHHCKCASALAHALITDPKLVPAASKKRLAAIIGKYIE